MENGISRSTALAAALVIGCGVIQPVSAEGYQSKPPREPAQAQGQSERAGTGLQEILDAHNHLRNQWGVSALGWNASLAQRAQSYAVHLASTGTFQHGDTAGVGQNLWQGTSGHFSRTSMVGSWGREAESYKDGAFPNVSTTGNWRDVGHFTQLIWKNTTQVGCGLARGGGNDVLVCDYYPPGNVTGRSAR
jgi:uncharacterized protein YkwD